MGAGRGPAVAGDPPPEGGHRTKCRAPLIADIAQPARDTSSRATAALAGDRSRGRVRSRHTPASSRRAIKSQTRIAPVTCTGLAMIGGSLMLASRSGRKRGRAGPSAADSHWSAACHQGRQTAVKNDIGSEVAALTECDDGAGSRVRPSPAVESTDSWPAGRVDGRHVSGERPATSSCRDDFSRRHPRPAKGRGRW